MSKNRGRYPSVDDIKKCAERKIATEADRELYVWYINSLLPAACGNKYEWPESKRPFEYPSTFHLQNKPNSQHIPCSTEAYIVAAWSNYIAVWKNQYDWLQQHEGEESKMPKPRIKKGKKPTDQEKQFLAKWTSSDDSSTNKWGGWRREGIIYFHQVQLAIAKARKTDECKEVERQGMEDLRLKLNITVTTEDEYLKTKRRKSTQRVEDQMEEVKFMYEA